MSSLIDLTGNRYGRIVVLSRADDAISKSGRHHVMWNCICDCGNTAIISGDALKQGKTISCGCYKKESISKRMSKHRMTDSKIYGVWCSMKSRCTNPSVPTYNDYGGRGINVCADWYNSFESFYDWSIKHGYCEGMSIDRINNNEWYCPENCRWVDRSIQANNRRSNRTLTYNGEIHTVTEWATILNKNPKTLFSRIYSGWDSKRILTT